MADRNHDSDTRALHRTGTAQAVIDNAGRHTDEDLGQAVDSSRGAWRIRGFPTMTTAVAVVLALWLAVVVILGAGGAFVTPPGTPPYPIAIAVTAPLVVVLVAFWVSAAFRKFVTNVDLSFLSAIQAWRFTGFTFLALYAYGMLPGRFAWHAGVGDMAIGLTAPWIALALVRRPSFAASRLFAIWNLLGILDLVTAIGDAALIQREATGALGEITLAPMAKLPLLLIPAYLVPLFFILHLSALLQARRVALTERGRDASPITSLSAQGELAERKDVRERKGVTTSTPFRQSWAGPGSAIQQDKHSGRDGQNSEHHVEFRETE
jgi:hypothetical protein